MTAHLYDATHRCLACDAPIYYDGGRWVDAREGETFDLCRESADGFGAHAPDRLTTKET